MKHRIKVPALFALALSASTAQAVQFANRSFENGTFDGWSVLGDTSIQTATFGSPPSHGTRMAVLTTLAERDPGWWGETPVSGTPAIPEPPCFYDTADPTEIAFCDPWDTSAIRQTINLRVGDTITFDYNLATLDAGDWVYFFLRDLEAQFPPDFDPVCTGAGCVLGTFVLLRPGLPVLESGIDLCPYLPGRPFCQPPPEGQGGITRETGWRTFSYSSAVIGERELWVGITDADDYTIPSAILLDNFRIRRVPESPSTALLGLALAGIGLSRRR